MVKHPLESRDMWLTIGSASASQGPYAEIAGPHDTERLNAAGISTDALVCWRYLSLLEVRLLAAGTRGTPAVGRNPGNRHALESAVSIRIDFTDLEITFEEKRFYLVDGQSNKYWRAA